MMLFFSVLSCVMLDMGEEKFQWTVRNQTTILSGSFRFPKSLIGHNWEQ